MRSSFKKFLVSFDDFGHKQPLTYRGSETFQTLAGAVCTVVTRVLSFAILVYYTIEMFEKKNPQVESYRLPVVEAEMRETGEVSLRDVNFYFGVYTFWDGRYQDVPPEVGRIKALAQSFRFDENGVF